ncbi:MAG: helix-turn-helix transcriptional regulator [Pseudomonadota bacterium]
MVASRLQTAQSVIVDQDLAKDLRRRLGRWLKLRREEKGMTQAELAEALNLRYYSFISQVENGVGRIPQELYPLWSKALNVKEEDFAWVLLAHLEPGLFRMLTGKVSPDPAEPVL